MSWRMVAGVVAATSIVLACSNGGSSESDPSPTTSGPTAFAAAFCSRVRDVCCTVAASSFEDCTTALDLGAKGRDPATADACLAELEAEQGDPGFCGGPLRLAPSCGGLVAIRVGITELRGREGDMPCTSSIGADGKVHFGTGASASTYSCAETDGLYCDATTKKCTPTGKLGEHCTRSSLACGSTRRCETISSRCVARRQQGEKCAAGGDECATGLGCLDEVCKRLKAEAEACAVGAECASTACTDGACTKVRPTDGALLTACHLVVRRSSTPKE